MAIDVDAVINRQQEDADRAMLDSWADDDRRMLHFLPEERGAVKINGKYPGRKVVTNMLSRYKDKYRR